MEFGVEKMYGWVIEPCIQCGKPTSLYFQGRPVCIDCDRLREGTDQTAPVKRPPRPETAEDDDSKRSERAAG
jgi:hypothetical protein